MFVIGGIVAAGSVYGPRAVVVCVRRSSLMYRLTRGVFVSCWYIARYTGGPWPRVGFYGPSDTVRPSLPRFYPMRPVSTAVLSDVRVLRVGRGHGDRELDGNGCTDLRLGKKMAWDCTGTSVRGR